MISVKSNTRKLKSGFSLFQWTKKSSKHFRLIQGSFFREKGARERERREREKERERSFNINNYLITPYFQFSNFPHLYASSFRMSYEASLIASGSGLRSQPCIVTGYPVIENR